MANYFFREPFLTCELPASPMRTFFSEEKNIERTPSGGRKTNRFSVNREKNQNRDDFDFCSSWESFKFQPPSLSRVTRSFPDCRSDGTAATTNKTYRYLFSSKNWKARKMLITFAAAGQVFLLLQLTFWGFGFKTFSIIASIVRAVLRRALKSEFWCLCSKMSD